MGNVAKNAILRALIEGAITDLMVKTKVDNVFVDDTTTLATKLTEIITSLNGKTTISEVTSSVNSMLGNYVTNTTLQNYPTTATMNAAISSALSDLINGAPAAYDSLKELADGIAENGNLVEALTDAIGNKADKATVDTIQATINALGSLATKSAVTENDLDASLKEKVNAASQGNHSHNNKELLDAYTQTESDLADAVSKKHSHSNKSALDGITSTKVASWDAKSKIYCATNQPTGLSVNDLWVQIVE